MKLWKLGEIFSQRRETDFTHIFSIFKKNGAFLFKYLIEFTIQRCRKLCLLQEWETHHNLQIFGQCLRGNTIRWSVIAYQHRVISLRPKADLAVILNTLIGIQTQRLKNFNNIEIKIQYIHIYTFIHLEKKYRLCILQNCSNYNKWSHKKGKISDF